MHKKVRIVLKNRYYSVHVKKQTSDAKSEQRSSLEKVPLMADQNPCLIPAPPILFQNFTEKVQYELQ